MTKTISSTKLNLFFPEWQGYGESNSVLKGANIIREHLQYQIAFTEIPVLPEEDLILEENVLGYQSVIGMLKSAKAVLETAQPDQTFMIGGTCASEIAPVSYLNKHYDGDIAVLWFDAHGDLNSPESSGSKHFHGMPLRCLLGEGPEKVSQLMFSTLSPDQVFLIGARDLDEPEKQFITDQQIEVLPPADLVVPEKLIQRIKSKGYKAIYLHLDLDILEPEDFPHLLIQVPNGVRYQQVKDLIVSLKKQFELIGSSIVEYVPQGEGDLAKIDELVNILQD